MRADIREGVRRYVNEDIKPKKRGRPPMEHFTSDIIQALIKKTMSQKPSAATWKRR